MKLRDAEESNKEMDEMIRNLKLVKEKLDGQARVVSEQLEVVQHSHDELVQKKSSETDLLSKEINQLAAKEKDVRQKL